MKQLFEIDLKDYKETDTVFRRPSARAIIIKDDKIALVYSKKEKYYKFPGGGIHDDEDKKEALIREVREEVGLVVIPESIREYGSVMRRQKSSIKDGEIFEQENYYYFCDVEDRVIEQHLDAYEGWPSYYIKQDLEVTMTDLKGKHPRKVTAMVYIMTEGHNVRLPMKGYVDVLAEGYERFGFDKEILRQALLEAKTTAEKEAEQYDFS